MALSCAEPTSASPLRSVCRDSVRATSTGTRTAVGSASASAFCSMVSNAAKLFTVPSDPAYGNVIKQFTFNAPDTNDYDSPWLPFGHEILFSRGEYRVLRKGVPGLSPDTSENLVTASGSSFELGDQTPALSPNGQWVAFSRKNAGSGWRIWKVPVTGGSTTPLTPETIHGDLT